MTERIEKINELLEKVEIVADGLLNMSSTIKDVLNEQLEFALLGTKMLKTTIQRLDKSLQDLQDCAPQQGCGCNHQHAVDGGEVVTEAKTGKTKKTVKADKADKADKPEDEKPVADIEGKSCIAWIAEKAGVCYKTAQKKLKPIGTLVRDERGFMHKEMTRSEAEAAVEMLKTMKGYK